jgi:hypothetical protein
MLACLRSPRVRVIIAGYAYAAAAAGIAISLTFALIATRFNNLSELGPTLLFGLLLSVFTIPVTFILAAPSAAGVTLLAERYRIRSGWFYAAMGVLSAVVAIVAIALVGQLVQGTSKTPSPVPRDVVAIVRELAGVLLVFGPAGLVGGLTYWARAGRNAGCTASPDRSHAGRKLAVHPDASRPSLRRRVWALATSNRAKRIHAWQNRG